MIRKWFGISALIVTAITLVNLSSCARDQKLVGIQVTPSTATFGGIGAQLQFRALGTYIHPPQTKDITAEATWTIDSQNLVTFGAPGNVTAISDCGTGNVEASLQANGNFVYGTAFISAAGVGTNACTQAALTVVVNGNGSVTSSPSGILCPVTCGAAFPLDASVTLSATLGTGATTVTWTSPSGSPVCSSTSPTTCSVTLNSNATITATFQ